MEIDQPGNYLILVTTIVDAQQPAVTTMTVDFRYKNEAVVAMNRINSHNASGEYTMEAIALFRL